MEYQQNICSICLTTEKPLTTLHKTTLQETLKLCVPEVQWQPNETICNVCVQKVENICAFREQCITSHLNKSNDTKIQQKKPQKRQLFKCEFCTEQFNLSKKLVVHALTIHNTTIKPYRCDKCGSCFKKSSNLNGHKKYHENRRDNVCSFCGKTFVTKGDLLIHEKKHLNKREYSCELCAKQFNTHKYLHSHKLIVHSDPKTWNFSCAICKKKFPIKSNYDQHIRRHIGEKRFECHLCDKKFVEKVVLKRHIKSHSNVRPFKCELCQMEYKEKKRLDVHLKKIHDDGDAKVKKYFCNLCPKLYFVKKDLTQHMNSHRGEKPFACEVCNKRFMDKYYVKQHLKNTHCVTK